MTPNRQKGAELKSGAPSIIQLADQGKAFVSAIQLAELTGASPSDIHYWARTGFLDREKKGHSPYPLRQLPKVQLMVLFTKRLQIRAEKASALADDLIRRYEGNPASMSGALGMVGVLDNNIGALVDLFLESDLHKRVSELVKEEP